MGLRTVSELYVHDACATERADPGNRAVARRVAGREQHDVGGRDPHALVRLVVNAGEREPVRDRVRRRDPQIEILIVEVGGRRRAALWLREVSAPYELVVPI